MGATLKYVKDFDFGSKPAKGGKDCACGGPVKKAKGGAVTERATGERYPSRKAMVKHEREETPTMQREELLQRSKVVAPGRRSVPVAPVAPLIGLKKGGKVGKC